MGLKSYIICININKLKFLSQYASRQVIKSLYFVSQHHRFVEEESVGCKMIRRKKIIMI